MYRENNYMKFGIVKFFNLAKGYGLIASDDGDEEFLVQKSEIDRAGLGQLAVKQRLGFDVAACAHGPSAVNLWATFANR